MNLRVSFSLRAFVFYFLTLAMLTWFLMGKAIERLSSMMEQATELVLIDTSQLASSLIEHELEKGQSLQASIQTFADIYAKAQAKPLNANVHGLFKTQINMQMYVTNAQGNVIYDTKGLVVGKNFGEWRDVKRTLRGEYGARTSDAPDFREMVIASPIRQGNQIIGVLSIRHSLKKLTETALIEAETLKKLALAGIFFVTILVFFLTRWLTNMMVKLAKFADAMATGARVPKPFFLDKRLDKLATSILNMREQIDGKAYVEQYVHSLTHELKTPITGINASTELLRDNTLTNEERQHFIANIDASNQRMADLVDRVLGLAKLEHQQGLKQTQKVNLNQLVNTTLRHFDPLNQTTKIKVEIDEALNVLGDEFLLTQALTNLLDNAIDFCPEDGVIQLCTSETETEISLSVINQIIHPIPDYALNKVFDRFYSTPRPNSHKRSTGLGLSFVREIMLLHNGKVTINNLTDYNQVKTSLIFNKINR